MGLLDSLLGGMRGSQAHSGGMSKMTMLLMALLAYRAYQSRSGPEGGYAPNPNAGPLGAPQGGGMGGGLGGGGLGGGLGDLLRGGMGGVGMGGGGGGGLGGILGGLLAGGAAGGLLSGGLGDLVRQFQQNGQGGIADSWVGRGPNAAISPDELERGLGDDNIRALAEQAGMPREQLLASLSEDLPGFVDSLTPEGRLPNEDEASQWV
jgi:uncharacterized protein YidB (DUF937 family)